MRDQAGHDPVGVPVEDPADVRRGLTLAELDLRVEKCDRVAAKPVDRNLERHPCAIAWTLKDERERTARERAAEITPRFGRVSQVEGGDDLVGCQVRDAQEIAAGERMTHPPIWLHRDLDYAPHVQSRAQSVTRYTVRPWTLRWS